MLWTKILLILWIVIKKAITNLSIHDVLHNLKITKVGSKSIPLRKLIYTYGIRLPNTRVQVINSSIDTAYLSYLYI